MVIAETALLLNPSRICETSLADAFHRVRKLGFDRGVRVMRDFRKLIQFSRPFRTYCYAIGDPALKRRAIVGRPDGT